jgi:hypothetical protein
MSASKKTTFALFSPSPVKREKVTTPLFPVIDLTSTVGEMEEEDIHSDSERSVDSVKVEKDKNGYSKNDPFLSKDRFSTPTRLPTVDESILKAPKKRVKLTSCTISSDRRKASEPCFVCPEKASILVFGKYPLCDECIDLSVGVALDHPKLTQIVFLRKEIDDVNEQLSRLEGSEMNTALINELKAGKRDMERAVIYLLGVNSGFI